MRSLRQLVLLIGVAVLAWLAGRGSAYVEERYTLPRVINESTNIVLMQVERVNKERKLIVYKKVADLKGKHPTDQIKHNVGVGGFNEKEQKVPIEWAEPGKLAIFFHNGGASETCIGKYWYQCYPGGEWWNHSHGEPYLARTYHGDIEGLKSAVEKLLKGEDAVIPCTVSRSDLRIHKVLASMKTPLAYNIVEAPSIEKTALKDVAGFSEMIELPRPAGFTQGAIPIDFDNDGWTDLLLLGTHGWYLLRNNQKGNFADVTSKWGLPSELDLRTAAFADYDRSGRMSLLTSSGKLYTNLGDKFRDDTERLPKTPRRVSNPGEAFAWVDINGDGLPDILCSVGVQGLTAYLNRGGKDGVWFEDVSEKVGLGESGLGTEPANFLTALDLDGSGHPGFILNLAQPLIARNRNGKFEPAQDTGLMFPTLARPAVAAADFLNNGQPGLFVTTNQRPGALSDWMMIGTFSEAEEKQLKLGADFSPQSRPEITLKDDRWTWRPIRARGTGILEIRRSQPVPNACYAHAHLTAPKDEKISLFIGTENVLTVWLNGKQVYENRAKREFIADQDKIEVEVKKGQNQVLLRVFDAGPLWRTSLRPAAVGLYPPASVQLYRRNEKGKFVDVTAQAGDLAQLRADAVTATWADLDNDGLLDLLVTAKTGLVRYYRNQGDGKFHYATPELGLEQKFKAAGAVTADFNKDGLLDLVLLGNDPDPCVCLMSKLKGKLPPLTVRFAGPDSPIGASVKLLDSAGKVLGVRYISGGDGRNLQTVPEARFAAAPGKYRIEVRYTSGQTRTREVALGERPVWEVIGK